MKKLLLLIPLLVFAGCATQQMGTRYVLDSAGNLQAQQYVIQNNEAEMWKIAGVITLGVIGLGTLAYLFDRNNNQDVQQTSPFILPANGTQTSTFSNSYILPDFQVVN